jgi:uroporphyrinogen decarboxylase
MVAAFKAAGAPHVFLHSDGNVLPLVEMLVDAGIDGLNPLERRAGMDPALLRRKFPKLVLIGGMDNTNTLINGPVSCIEEEARQLIDMGREGGLIIGTHSVSPEISLENFAAYDRCCRTYGDFSRA